MALRLRVTGTAGDGIEHVAAEIQRLADRLDLVVEMNANGVELIALPGGSEYYLVKGYERVSEEGSGNGAFRMVFSNGHGRTR
jgi:4-hydroxyphenylpyruvate dioxygenase-like putative hemolysin